MDDQPFGVRLTFVLGVLALIPAIALGGLAVTGLLRDDPSAAAAPATSASPTGDIPAAQINPTAEAPAPKVPAATPSAQDQTKKAVAAPTPSAAPSTGRTPAIPAVPTDAAEPAAEPATEPTAEPAAPPPAPAPAPMVPYSGTPPTTHDEVRAVYDYMAVAAGLIRVSPDPRKVDALYASECGCYRPTRDDIAGRQERGEFTVGGLPKVLEFEVRSTSPGPEPGFGVRIRLQPDRGAKTFNPAGEVVDHNLDAGPQEFELSAVARNSGWYFTQIDEAGE